MIKIENMTNDQFRVCMETVSRMGVLKKSAKDPNKKFFYQSCYIVKIYGEYYIAYFKEIMNKKMEDVDFARLNTVALLLEKWKLAKVLDKEKLDAYGSLPSIFVVPFKDKQKYEKKNKLTNNQISKYIQIQIKKREVETALKMKNSGEKEN